MNNATTDALRITPAFGWRIGYPQCVSRCSVRATKYQRLLGNESCRALVGPHACGGTRATRYPCQRRQPGPYRNSVLGKSRVESRRRCGVRSAGRPANAARSCRKTRRNRRDCSISRFDRFEFFHRSRPRCRRWIDAGLGNHQHECTRH